jgi:hypothetical protein
LKQRSLKVYMDAQVKTARSIAKTYWFTTEHAWGDHGFTTQSKCLLLKSQHITEYSKDYHLQKIDRSWREVHDCQGELEQENPAWVPLQHANTHLRVTSVASTKDAHPFLAMRESWWGRRIQYKSETEKSEVKYKIGIHTPKKICKSR